MPQRVTIAEGFGSELGIDFNGLFAYTNFGPADQVNFSDIGLVPSPTVTSKEFEFALRRDVIRESGDVLFPQGSIRLLFRDPNTTMSYPIWGAFVYDFNEASACRKTNPIPVAKTIPLSCVYVPTTSSAMASFIPFANRGSNALFRPWTQMSICSASAETPRRQRSNHCLTTGFPSKATWDGKRPRMAI